MHSNVPGVKDDYRGDWQLFSVMLESVICKGCSHWLL